MTTTTERAAIMAEVDKALAPLKAMGGYYDTLAATIGRAFHAAIHFGAADDEPDAAENRFGAIHSLAGEAPPVEPSTGPDPSTGGAHPVLERL